jgi:hypothetical protein
MNARHSVWCLASIVVLLALSIEIRTQAQATAALSRSESSGAQAPDITGSWERYGFVPGGARGGGARDATIPPPAPQPVLKPEYAKQWQARTQAARDAAAKGEPLATDNVHCIPEGMPSMMGAQFPIEILQSRGQITIIEEAFTQVRRILMDRPQKTLDDIEPGFFGYSVGKWESGTLVVDTIGIKENVRFQNIPHSPQMRIRERLKLVSPDVMWNEITIEDPVVLEKPHTYTVAYRRMPNYTLLEYVCEDNREYADDQGRQRIRVDPGR